MHTNRIELTARQRKELEEFSATGVHNARLINRTKIILALDASCGRNPIRPPDIAKCFGLSRQTVYTARNDFLTAKNAPEFPQRKRRLTPPVPAKVTGELEARIIALACGQAPQGYSRWTLRLLADKCVTVQRNNVTYDHKQAVKKNELKPHLKSCWCIPPAHNGAFVQPQWRMFWRYMSVPMTKTGRS